MRSLLRYLVVPLYPVLFAAVWVVLPVSGEEHTSARPPQLKHVLLKNGEFLRGTVQRETDYVVVDDGTSRFRIRRDQVAFVGDSLSSLYQFKRSRTDNYSADAQLKLVAWCTDKDFIAAAVYHLAKARHLQPNHHRIPELQARLQVKLQDRGGLVAVDSAKPIAGNDAQLAFKPNAETDATSAKLPAAADESASSAGSPVPLAETPVNTENHELTRYFTSRVQPILLNRCALAHCHGHASDNQFALRRVPGIRQQSRDITIHNLKATSQYIIGSTPDETELLRRATKAHGRSTSKLLVVSKKQQDVLVTWTAALIQKNGGALNKLDANKARTISGAEAAHSSHTLVPPPIVASQNIQASIDKKTDIGDPFNPDIFNRRHGAAEPESDGASEIDDDVATTN